MSLSYSKTKIIGNSKFLNMSIPKSKKLPKITTEIPNKKVSNKKLPKKWKKKTIDNKIMYLNTDTNTLHKNYPLNSKKINKSIIDMNRNYLLNYTNIIPIEYVLNKYEECPNETKQYLELVKYIEDQLKLDIKQIDKNMLHRLHLFQKKIKRKWSNIHIKPPMQMHAPTDSATLI